MEAERRVLLPPPIWFLLAAGVQRLITRHRAATTVSRVVAMFFATASGMLAVAAVAALARAHTAIGPEHPENATTLVTGGPFRFTRNPIYVAMAGLLVAHAALRRSPVALIPPAGFTVLMDRTQITVEERALRSRFSGSYDRYAQATPRWLIRRSSNRVH